MSAADCIRLIRERAPDLTDEELEDLAEDLARRVRARRAQAGRRSLDEDFLDAADALAADIAEAAQIERRNRMIAMVRRQTLLDLVARAEAATGDPSLGLEAAMVGVNARFPGARRSVDAEGKAIFRRAMGGMIADLRQAGLLRVYNSRSLDREIARELAEVTKPPAVRQVGLTGSPEAARIAAIVERYRSTLVARQNRAGAWIKPLPGYITRQSHAMHKLRAAGRADWIAAVRPLLDEERTFAGADPDDFLARSYDALATGLHERAHGAADGDLRIAFTGPGNLAKRISQHRVLHFRDADAWLAYNDRFGVGGVTESITREMERGARNAALMEAFGPNPRAMFDDLRRALRRQYRDDTVKHDRIARQALEWQFREIDGTAATPVNASAARLASGVRAVQTMAKLGGAFISSWTDLAFQAGEIRHQQGRLLAAWGQALAHTLGGFRGGARRHTADLIGAGLDGMIGDLAARFSTQDGPAGLLAGAQQVFMKLNLLGPWTDASKRGLAMMMARDLATQAAQDWAGLRPQTRALLSHYGLDAERWAIARQAVRTEADGRAYLMPDQVERLDAAAFGDLAPRDGRRLRDEIVTALTSLYIDRGEFASPTAGARERALLRLGTRPGTPEGEALRFMTQFKSFAVTVVTRPLGRDVYGQGARTLADALLRGQGDMIGLVGMIVGATVLGYVAMAAKQVARGVTPSSPDDHNTWIAAALQGGGLGLYGDFFLGQTNRFGRSLLDSLAGPTLGAVADIDELRALILAGDPAGPKAVRTLLSNTPYANLFYTRLALDYLVTWQIFETMHPGYLRRMERSLARQQGQRYLLPPSQAIPRGGGGLDLDRALR